MSGSRMQVQLIRCLSCQSFLTVIDNTSIAMVKLLMTLVVAALVAALVVRSSASPDGEEPPNVMQDVDLEGERTINLVTDVMVRT